MTSDVGEADPALNAALLAGDLATIRTVFLAARVLVPIVALGQESDAAEMAVPRLVGADGRHALPVFTSYDALRAWDADARPVPMVGEKAIAGAVGEGYAALVLDVAGPIPHTLDLDVSRPHDLSGTSAHLPAQPT